MPWPSRRPVPLLFPEITPAPIAQQSAGIEGDSSERKEARTGRPGKEKARDKSGLTPRSPGSPFNASLADPNAPLGDPLPEGGGEPGKAYLAWVDAVHAGDVEAMKGMVPAEMAAELDGPEAAEALEFMALLMPKDIRIIGGSSDGSTAILSIEATMEGQAASGEVTMQHRDGFWMETGISIQ